MALFGSSVLVTDDDPAICGLIAHILMRNGYAVETASNGADVVEKLDSTE